jgi:hypothetical protein
MNVLFDFYDRKEELIVITTSNTIDAILETGQSFMTIFLVVTRIMVNVFSGAGEIFRKSDVYLCNTYTK